MKKTFLLLAAGVIAATAQGQQMSRQSVIFDNAIKNQGLPTRGYNNPGSPAIVTTARPGFNAAQLRNSHRTTSACNCRWYDYSGLFQYDVDSMNLAGVTSTADTIGFGSLPIWWDTTSLVGYTSGSSIVYDYNPYVTYGMGFDPMGNQWNNPTLFPDTCMAITNSTAYTIDSIQIIGWYERSYATAAKIAVVDTLIVSFVQGNPAGTTATAGDMPSYYFTGPTSYTTGDLYFADMGHDSVNNRSGHTPGTATTAPPLTYTGTAAGPVYKFLLKSTDTNGSDGAMNTTFPRGTYNGVAHADGAMSYPVSAGNMVGVSVTFHSGDHTYGPTGGGVGDTIRFISGTTISGYKYGNWEGSIFFNSSDGTTANPEYGPYLVSSENDWTSGYWKREGPGNYRDGGWGGHYEPNWSWGGPATLQYASVNFFAECPTCSSVGNESLGINKVYTSNKVNAYPNPTSGTLNISYTLVRSMAITASITNMLGQIVATQNVAENNSGNVIFNTASMPAGVYIYNLDGDGLHASGRVVVAR